MDFSCEQLAHSIQELLQILFHELHMAIHWQPPDDHANVQFLVFNCKSAFSF